MSVKDKEKKQSVLVEQCADKWFSRKNFLVISGVFSRILAGCLIWDRLLIMDLSIFICKMETVYLQDSCGINDVYRISGVALMYVPFTSKGEKWRTLQLRYYIFSKELLSVQFSSVQFTRSVVSDSLQLHESQHARPPCLSPSPGVHSDPRPSSL